LETPVVGDDDVPWFVAPVAMTVTASACHIDTGTATVSIQDAADTVIDAPTCSTSNPLTWDTSITAGSVAAGTIIEFDTVANSGSAWQMVCIGYTTP
jgi:hypothetical protein